MSAIDVVTLSRIQFGMTALYHFLFVPLTLGLSLLIAIMESVYVMTRRAIWRDMTKFWGLLFGINFAMGVATGITMEFQFGTNWAYYSHYVGDIFGAPLAIEGLMAFFLEASFLGVLLFGRRLVPAWAHFLAAFMVAFGTLLSSFWILATNSWMQTPQGYKLVDGRFEPVDWFAIVFSPSADSAFGILSNLVRLGLGGKQGSGRQFVSWIHERDFARAVEFLVAREDLDGPVNVAAPNPLPNRGLMAGLREAWGVPNGFPAPSLAVKIGAFFLRTESELVLKSRRVVPGRLLDAGFEFEFPEWAEAAEDLVMEWRHRDD